LGHFEELCFDRLGSEDDEHPLADLNSSGGGLDREEDDPEFNCGSPQPYCIEQTEARLAGAS